MTTESLIKMFSASIKDRNLDGEYLMLMKAEDPGLIFDKNIPTIILEVMRFNKKGVGESLAGIIFAKEIAETSQTLCSESAYKLALWILHNSLLKAPKLPIRTNLLKMEEEGDKEGLLERCIKGIKDLNEVVSYSATMHYSTLCENKSELIDYLIKINSLFFDFAGICLSQTGVFIKYLIENDVEQLDKFVSCITKRYAFINRIDTQPALQEIKENVSESVKKILREKNKERILSKVEIHGAADGFLMLKYDEISELIEELQDRKLGKEEFLDILWLAALKRAILFNPTNKDFKANKSLGWQLSISGLTYLHGIKYISENVIKIGIEVDEDILANWFINAIWLIIDSQKVSLTGELMLERLDSISENNIKDDNFSYEKMVETATHMYPEQAIKEAFGFAYNHPESSFEVVCQMVNYLFEYDNGDEDVETSFLRLGAALIDIVRSDFATMLGSYSSALVALTLANRTIFNFGQGNSRYQLVEEMANMFKKKK